MRRVLPALVLAAGCAGPEGFQSDPGLLPTADVREQELQRNLRPGLSWAEQERRMADTKAVFGTPSDPGDATGPATANPAR
jgi:hypothetical protein